MSAGAAGAPPPPPPRRRPRVLLCLSGSVACVKAAELAAALLRFADVRVVASAAAARFLAAGPPLPAAAGAPLTDADEWAAWRALGDPVAHVELRRWADAAVVAPASANTLAKLAGGLCDTLLTCVARAWDPARPLLVAPAMNTHMWASPLTAAHLAACAALGHGVVPPVSKRLACGDVGEGGMAAPADVAAAVEAALAGNARWRRVAAGEEEEAGDEGGAAAARLDAAARRGV